MEKLVVGFSWKAVFTKKRLKIYGIIAVVLLILVLLTVFSIISFEWLLNIIAAVIALGILELVFIPISRQYKELGLFLDPDWFLQYGIRGVVTFTGVTEGKGTIFSGTAWCWQARSLSSGVNKFHAKGINPVTYEEQEFIQLYTGYDIALPHDRRRFQTGDRF